MASFFETLIFSEYRIMNVKEDNSGDENGEYDQEYEEYMDMMDDYVPPTTNDIYSANHPWDTRSSSTRYRFRPDLWCDVVYEEDG